MRRRHRRDPSPDPYPDRSPDPSRDPYPDGPPDRHRDHAPGSGHTASATPAGVRETPPPTTPISPTCEAPFREVQKTSVFCTIRTGAESPRVCWAAGADPGEGFLYP